MDIDTLTIGQAKEIAKLLNGTLQQGTSKQEKEHGKNPAIGQYCIVRCNLAGVHAGIVDEANSEFTVLVNSGRMWYWKSKFTLSEAANTGIEDGSKIAAPLDQLIIPTRDIAEYIPTSAKARKTIEGAKIYEP